MISFARFPLAQRSTTFRATNDTILLTTTLRYQDASLGARVMVNIVDGDIQEPGRL
jgi:hypothetical protein